MDSPLNIEFKEQDFLKERREKVSAFIANELQISSQVLGENANQIAAILEFEARPYQQDAWAALWDARDEGASRALIRLATGLGKTSVAVFDYAKFRSDQAALGQDSRALFVVHQNNILSQASDRFGEALPTASRSRYTNSQQRLPASEITFATFQTLREGARRFPPTFFDYIIYDEAHHIEADTYKKVVDYFQPQFQLGLTATPYRMDRRDITDHFGEVLYSKTLPEAIQEGSLADVEYNVMFDDAVKRALKDGFQPRNTAEIRALFEVRSRNEVIVLKIKEVQEKIRQEEGIENVKTIIFCENIDSIEEFAELINGQGYHSKLKPHQQEKVFQDFMSDETESIIVRDMFNEGVDIPEARLIVFLRSTQSKPIFEQQLGRGMRRTETKQKVTVMDFVANIERLIMLEEMTEIIFNEDIEKGLEDLGEEQDETIFSTEHSRFIFDRDIINLIHSYNQLLNKEGGSIWRGVSNDEIIKLALSLSPNKPMYLKDIVALNRRQFPGLGFIQNRFGGIAEFQRACGFEMKDWDTYNNQDIVALAKSISPDKALQYEDAIGLDGELFPRPNYIRNRFGSWAKFQVECGYNVIEWTSFSNDELIDLAKQLSPDEPLTKSRINALSRDEFPSSQTIVRRFGSMVAFHELCGYEAATSWKEYDNQDLIDLALSLSPNKPLATNDIKMLDRSVFPDVTLIYERFGSLTEFHKQCGFIIKPHWSKYSDEEIGALARRLNPDTPMTIKDIEAYGGMEFPRWSHLQDRFGTLQEFHRTAGFNIFNAKSLSNEDILDMAREVLPHEAVSTRLLVRLSADKLFVSPDTIHRRFGSITKFNKQRGYKPKMAKYTKDLDLSDIVTILNSHFPGEAVSGAQIDEYRDELELPTSTTIFKKFGGSYNLNIARGIEVVNTKEITQEEIIAMADEISPGKAMTTNEMADASKEQRFVSQTLVRKYFGGLNELNRARGYEPNKERSRFADLSNEELIARSIKIAPSGHLTKRAIEALSKQKLFVSDTIIKQRFGSVQNFNEARGPYLS
jgi:superfamily II DNA or RNA helicase